MQNEFAGGHVYGYGPIHAYNGPQSSSILHHPANPHHMNDQSSRRPTSRGGRRLSPDELIPINAPTQARRYTTPSATSRKEVPAFFQKMRKQTPPDDEEDELIMEEGQAPNATDHEKIGWKRRQNTLAARRSRAKKLENLQRLEEAVKQLAKEKEIWRTRALTLRQLLISHGIICPEFQDD